MKKEKEKEAETGNGGKYVKAEKDGEVIYLFSPGGAEVPIYKWGFEEFINFCLFPIQSMIEIMRQEDEENPHEAILSRLYGSAMARLEEMTDLLENDLGEIRIVTTNFPAREFMTEEILCGEIRPWGTKVLTMDQSTRKKLSDVS